MYVSILSAGHVCFIMILNSFVKSQIHNWIHKRLNWLHKAHSLLSTTGHFHQICMHITQQRFHMLSEKRKFTSWLLAPPSGHHRKTSNFCNDLGYHNCSGRTLSVPTHTAVLFSVTHWARREISTARAPQVQQVIWRMLTDASIYCLEAKYGREEDFLWTPSSWALLTAASPIGRAERSEGLMVVR